MTDPTDHAAEAERLRKLANDYETRHSSSTSTDAAQVVIGAVANGYAHAQVHATLAVAAELRTANLIAARAQSEYPRVDLRDDNSWETVQQETDERIRERLGLS